MQKSRTDICHSLTHSLSLQLVCVGLMIDEFIGFFFFILSSYLFFIIKINNNSRECRQVGSSTKTTKVSERERENEY